MLLLVLDNCSSHSSPLVLEAIDLSGWILQVYDAAVQGLVLTNRYWGGDAQDYGCAADGTCLVYWDFAASGSVLTRISTKGEMITALSFNLLELRQALHHTKALHCIARTGHYYFAGHVNNIIYGNQLGIDLESALHDLYAKLLAV